MCVMNRCGRVLLCKRGKHATEVTKWVVISTICFLLCSAIAFDTHPQLYTCSHHNFLKAQFIIYMLGSALLRSSSFKHSLWPPIAARWSAVRPFSSRTLLRELHWSNACTRRRKFPRLACFNTAFSTLFSPLTLVQSQSPNICMFQSFRRCLRMRSLNFAGRYSATRETDARTTRGKCKLALRSRSLSIWKSFCAV